MMMGWRWRCTSSSGHAFAEAVLANLTHQARTALRSSQTIDAAFREATDVRLVARTRPALAVVRADAAIICYLARLLGKDAGTTGVCHKTAFLQQV
jgi:hypothetical protein